MDLFYIIIIAIVLIFLDGLLYVIYLPFKKWLQKSNKLTEKLNRRINLAFILVPCIISIVLYYFKDYRTPSKERLEQSTDIKLPTDFKVLKDEYQDMMQDYDLFYDIQLRKNATTNLVKSIKQSRFYNSNLFHNGVWTESDFISADSMKAVWSKSPKGFDFYRKNRGTQYYIKLDTVTNILQYNEECY